ncbi:MAG: hypothetical protein HKP48_07055 [Winogradskyella sp.]|nr:hypothetical protein [Winogradskyella sp.]MBT8245252.1 hypothetical protein [Winogradskyella sp.]NNK23041.1 hypothetical protein [Winogradskyella sp.]
MQYQFKEFSTDAVFSINNKSILINSRAQNKLIFTPELARRNWTIR